MQLNGKTAVITGASSGIGLETLKLLLAQGCRVVACARNIDAISIESENLYLKKCDVSRCEELDELFRFAQEKLGSIDLFFSNAGFAYYEKLDAPDWAHTDAIMNTNFTAMVYAAEKMKQLHGAEPYNFAVTASAMGLLSLPGYALYSATKAAVRGFADAYRYELEKGQVFQVIYPIATRTRFFRRAAEETPIPWPVQDAAAVAKRIVRGIRRDQKRIFPSGAFLAAHIANRVLPFLFPIYVAVNDRAFRRWQKRKAK